MTVSKLIQKNKLEQADSGLWHLPGADIEQEFAYSDGDDEETYVKKIIANATDTSSTSAELESHIHDWPSEYHLTTKRAHLLRALDLSSLENVLELGCGCGAISRYLAEQGMSVDAIEGSARRASIAYSRCRDLNNINIINSNFNHLELPEKAYDAVFLIGVLEYAKRFCPDAADDRAAVLEILAAVQKSLTAGGVVITAIENRLGLKYLMGATEDHYGVPYIGINHYPDSAGIRTYDQTEWRDILAEAGLDNNTFLAPFPDYKIPSVVLHEDFLQQPDAPAHLRGSVSRDYLRGFSSDFDEQIFWQACNQNGSMLEFCNSYLIVAGAANDTADKLAAYDFAHFTGAQRKPEFRTATRKRRDESIVRKIKLLSDSDDTRTQTGLVQNCINEEYLSGDLLADVWLQSLKSWQDQQRLISLYKDYYEFINNYSSQGAEVKDLIDVLPFNIIVNEAGNYQSFDREWVLDEKITAEFVLFRALLWFVYGNSKYFAAMFEANGWHSIRDYLITSFDQLGLSLEAKLDDFADREDRFQTAIGVPGQEHLIRSLLDSIPQASSGETTFHPQLYWSSPGEHYAEQNSIKATAVLGTKRQQVRFELTAPLASNSMLRFDPSDREGYFHFYSLKLTDADSGNILLDLNSVDEIAKEFTMKGMSVYKLDNNSVLLAHDRDPHIEYRLSTAVINLRVEIEMDWPHSEEFEIISHGLKQEHAEWLREKTKLENQMEDLNACRQQNQQLQADHDELIAIKASRAYRMTRKLAKIIKR